MLGTYIDTIIIAHKISKMLSILNTLTLQKKLQNFVTKMYFRQKSKNSTTTKQKIYIIILARARNQTRDLLHSSRMCYLWITDSTENIDCC